jgi:predicted esterase
MLRHIKQYAARAGTLLKLGAALLMTGVLSGALPVAVSTAKADGWQSLPNGSVVAQLPMVLPTALQAIATGQRVWYVSTDYQNNKVLVTEALITPLQHPAHPYVVAWAHGTTGWANGCAPSANLSVFWPEAVDAVQSYLQQGWVVAATDYQGLGSPGPHQYLVGNTEARSVIDSVRAARNLNPDLSANWVASGHSQGGQAAIFAGQIANTYGNGLHLKGVIAMAPASHLDTLAPEVVGTPNQGYIPLLLLGLNAADPSIDPSAILGQKAQNRLPIAKTLCLTAVGLAYANLTPDELLVGGQLPASVLAKAAQLGNPGQQASSAPIFMVQGTDDTTVPPTLTQQLQTEECAYSTPSVLQMVTGATHDTIPTLSTGIVSQYITDRFNGLPAPSGC